MSDGGLFLLIGILFVGLVIYYSSKSIGGNTVSFGKGATYEIDTENSIEKIVARKTDRIHRRSKIQSILPLHIEDEEHIGEPFGVVVDVETTGLISYDGTPTKKALKESPDAFPRIVEFAWFLFYTDEKRSDYSLGLGKSYIIRQEKEIPQKAYSIHGISTELSQQVGREIEDVLKEFSEDILDCGYLIGHNVMFDKRVIESEFVRAGIQKPFRGFRNKDTMKLSAAMAGRNRPSLAYAKETILPKNITDKLDGHVALDDCVASALLFAFSLKSGRKY